MQLALLLFLIALTGTLLGRARYLKIYGQETGNVLSSRVTGAELAEAILRQRGVSGVAICKSQGLLPDFYDPESRRITLSPQHFGGASFSSLALAALQAGKAIQHYEGHRPLLWRVAAIRWSVYVGTGLVGVGLVAMVLGMGKTLLPLVVLVWSLIAIWNFLTVPTEVDACLRAQRLLEEMRVFRNLDERIGVERVMGAASTAYIDGVSVVGTWLARQLKLGSKEVKP